GSPIRTPAGDPSMRAVRSGTGRLAVLGSAGSWPAMACRTSAQSRTVRVNGPTVSRLCATGTQPSWLTRPYVGRSPAIPQYPAGTRIEPPVSVPRPARTRPAATAAAVALLEPPGIRSRFQGLRVIGKPMVGSGLPSANSYNPVLPTKTAPASRSLRTAVASGRRPQLGFRTLLLAVVGASAV